MSTLFDDLQLVIPEEPHTRNTDPITSHEAAASVRNITETHNRILTMLQEHGPATDEQLFDLWWRCRTSEPERWPHVSPSGLRSRRAELVDAGYVADSGDRGKTRSGRSCIIWKAVA